MLGIPGSRLDVLDGIGHFPHAEAPAQVAAIIDNFIATTPAGLSLLPGTTDEAADQAR